MYILNILATAVEESVTEKPSIVPLDLLWDNITSLNIVEALTFIAFGIVCLLYGWRVFKVLVVITFGLLGLVIGMFAWEKIAGSQNQIFAGIVSLILLAAVSVPLMRWAVSILGALAGGVLTSGIWYACHLPEQYIWAGGLVGLVAGGMISFIIFRISVMLFSSFGGSFLIIVGFFALLHQYPSTQQDIHDLIFYQKWFLPISFLLPTALGVYFQNKFIKGAQDWSL